MKSAFTIFKNSEQAKSASLKYSGTPFSYVLEQAQGGDKNALYFFVLQCLNVIVSAYVKFYIAGRIFEKEDISEKSHDYFNNFVAYLYTLTNTEKGPFFSFTRNVFITDQDDTFILNKFRYYMYRYAQKIAGDMYEEEKEIKDQEIEQSEYNRKMSGEGEEYNAFEEIPNEKRMISTRRKNKERIKMNYEVQKKQVEEFIFNNKPFMDYLKQRGKIGKKYYDTLIMLAQGKTRKEISQAMNLNLARNYSGLWMRIKAIKKRYDKFKSKA